MKEIPPQERAGVRRRTRRLGYTLIEVMMAVSVLSVGVGAAAHLSLTMRKQEEANTHSSRALSMLEGAHRLYQLGLEPAQVMALVPLDPTAVLSSGAAAVTVPAQVSAMEGVQWSVECTAIPGQVVGGSVDSRTFSVTSLRENIRY